MVLYHNIKKYKYDLKNATQNMTAPFFTLFSNIIEHIRTENIENSAPQQVELFSW